MYLLCPSMTHNWECCLVYSHTTMAPLTWTLSDLMTPNCGISTDSSSECINSTGIPSRSLLQRKWRETDITMQILNDRCIILLLLLDKKMVEAGITVTHNQLLLRTQPLSMSCYNGSSLNFMLTKPWIVYFMVTA